MVEAIHDEADLFCYLHKADHVALYGAGKMAEGLLPVVLRLGGYPEAVLLSELPNGKTDFHGIPIRLASDTAIPRSTFVIIAAGDMFWCEMVQRLEQNGYEKFAVLSDAFLDRLAPKPILYNQAPRTMLRFEVHVTEHCNLNCFSCHHFSPLARSGFLDLAEYDKDCRRLSELFDGACEFIRLLGGEPLLHPGITDIMRITREHFSYGHIMLVTNGLLLAKMPEAFWRSCHEHDIEVRPTIYPITCDYAQVGRMAEQFHVTYIPYNSEEPVRALNRYPLTCKGSEPVEENFRLCNLANDCIELKHGRMYTCPFAAYAEHLTEYFALQKEMQVSIRDSVNIYDVSSGDELMERLSRPIPFCRYCKVRERAYGLPYRTSQRKRSEWLDD